MLVSGGFFKSQIQISISINAYTLDFIRYTSFIRDTQRKSHLPLGKYHLCILLQGNGGNKDSGEGGRQVTRGPYKEHWTGKQ